MKNIKSILIISTVLLFLFAGTHDVSATTTPAISGNISGNEIFTSNYYGSSAFGESATRSLKILGYLSASLGVLLLAGKALTARYY